MQRPVSKLALAKGFDPRHPQCAASIIIEHRPYSLSPNFFFCTPGGGSAKFLKSGMERTEEKYTKQCPVVSVFSTIRTSIFSRIFRLFVIWQ